MKHIVRNGIHVVWSRSQSVGHPVGAAAAEEAEQDEGAELE